MKVSTILDQKGHSVVTVPPEATVDVLADVLAKHNIGAVVVSADGISVDGIVSERDVVRAIATLGADIVDARIDAIMTPAVAVCDAADSTDDLMLTMTERRIRHVPVVADEKLDGIVSIGDVVRVTVAQLEEDKATLLGYITQ